METFKFGDAEVRALLIKDKIWIVFKDVCDAIEIDNNRQAATQLREKDVTKSDVTDSLGRPQLTLLVSEPGLYRFLARSNMAKAEPFQDWLFEEVVPQIRQTGVYVGSASMLTQNEQNMVMGLYEEEIRNLARTKGIRELDIYFLIYKTIFPSGTYENLTSNTERRWDGWRYRRYVKGTNKQALLYWFLTENGITLNKYYQGQIAMLLKLVSDGKQFKEISAKLYNNKEIGM